MEHWVEPIKYQCGPHIENSQLICTADQLTGFCMRATPVFNRLNGLRSEAYLQLNQTAKLELFA